MKWFVLFVTSLGFVEPAIASCFEPNFFNSIPSAYLRRPSVPYCLSNYSYSGQHSCDQWEIDSYLSDIDNYIDDLNAFIDEANRFASDARQYASEVYEFAECEAREVQSQHE